MSSITTDKLSNIFFYDAFTLICPLTIHNLERVSFVSLCLHFLLNGCHAGQVIIRGAYHGLTAVSMIRHSGKSFDI